VKLTFLIHINLFKKYFINLNLILSYLHPQDGLRFNSAVELKTHTDEYLERKKGLQKKRDSLYREYREWYCSSSQWVSDFDAAGPGGVGAVGGEKKEGVIGELNC
jgi:hypothetical protein